MTSPLGIGDVTIALSVRHNQRAAAELRPGAAVVEVERNPAVSCRNRRGRIQRSRPLRPKANIAGGDEVADASSLVVPGRTVRKAPAHKIDLVGIVERIGKKAERSIVLRGLGNDRPQPAIRKIVDLVRVRRPRGVDGSGGGNAPGSGGGTIRRDVASPCPVRLRPVAAKGVAGLFRQLDFANLRALLQEHAIRSKLRSAVAVERDGVLHLGSPELPMRVESRVAGKRDCIALLDLRPAYGGGPPALEVVAVAGRLGERRVLRAMVYDDEVVALEPTLAGIQRDGVAARHRDRGRGGNVGIPLCGNAVKCLKAARRSLRRRRQRPRAAGRGRILDLGAAIRRIGGGDGIRIDRMRGAVVLRRHIGASKPSGGREGVLARAVVDEEPEILGEDGVVRKDKDERRVERTGLGRNAGKVESVRSLLEADAGREARRRRRLHQPIGEDVEIRADGGVHVLAAVNLDGALLHRHVRHRLDLKRAVSDDFEDDVPEMAVLVDELPRGKSVAIDSNTGLRQARNAGKGKVRGRIEPVVVQDFQVVSRNRLFGAVVGDGL